MKSFVLIFLFFHLFQFIFCLKDEIKFYIYPLESKYWWTWPNPTSNCSKHSQLSHLHSLNMGKIIHLLLSL